MVCYAAKTCKRKSTRCLVAACKTHLIKENLCE